MPTDKQKRLALVGVLVVVLGFLGFAATNTDLQGALRNTPRFRNANTPSNQLNLGGSSNSNSTNAYSNTGGGGSSNSSGFQQAGIQNSMPAQSPSVTFTQEGYNPRPVRYEACLQETGTNSQVELARWKISIRGVQSMHLNPITVKSYIPSSSLQNIIVLEKMTLRLEDANTGQLLAIIPGENMTTQSLSMPLTRPAGDYYLIAKGKPIPLAQLSPYYGSNTTSTLISTVLLQNSISGNYNSVENGSTHPLASNQMTLNGGNMSITYAYNEYNATCPGGQ